MGSPWLESKYVIFVQFTSKGYCIMARDFVLAWASWFECHLLIDVLKNFIYLLCWVADSIIIFLCQLSSNAVNIPLEHSIVVFQHPVHFYIAVWLYQQICSTSLSEIILNYCSSESSSISCNGLHGWVVVL